jgi:hypothetical protein
MWKKGVTSIAMSESNLRGCAFLSLDLHALVPCDDACVRVCRSGYPVDRLDGLFFSVCLASDARFSAANDLFDFQVQLRISTSS